MPNLTNSDRESGTQETPVVSNPDVFKQALDEVLSELPTRTERTGEVMLRKASSARKPSHTLGVGFQPCRRSFSSSPQRAPHPGASDWANWIQRLCLAAMIGSAGFIVFLFLFGYSWSPAHQTEIGRTVASYTATPRTRPIQDVEVGDRVAGRNPIREQAEGIEPDPATWRKISFYMTKETGLELWIDLLRPLEWIEEYDAKLGSTIFIDLYEMGAVGNAEVTYLGPCPDIKPGRGTVVTGTFKHRADKSSNVVRLKLEGQKELTGVTDNHAYWSVDRQDFVEVGNLRIGETVDTEYGVRRVISVTPIEYTDFLYNIETTEHVYRVGSLGTLVHNSCALTRYADDGGHHIFSKRAFEGLAGYNADDALAIGQRELSNLKLKHLGSDSLTTTQQRLFRELAQSGRPNTLAEHARIAREVLIEHGVDPKEAGSVVRKALNQLRSWEIAAPNHLPWGGY